MMLYMMNKSRVLYPVKMFISRNTVAVALEAEGGGCYSTPSELETNYMLIKPGCPLHTNTLHTPRLNQYLWMYLVIA